MENTQGQDTSAATGQAGDASHDDSTVGKTFEEQLHAERSKRGREVSSLKSEIDSLKQTISDLLGTVSRRAPDADEGKPPVEYITTPADLEAYNSWKEEQEGKARRSYAGIYVKSVKSLAYLNQDMHDEIEKELLASDTKYMSHTNFKDPVKDAEINYRSAEATVLKRKLKEISGKPNVKGGTDSATGVTATSDGVAHKAGVVELDEYAKKFIRGIGEKEDAEWVQKSLQRK